MSRIKLSEAFKGNTTSLTLHKKKSYIIGQINQVIASIGVQMGQEDSRFLTAKRKTDEKANEIQKQSWSATASFPLTL